MKVNVTLAALAAALCFTGKAQADEDPAGPTQDLTPTSLRFQKIAGEFGRQTLRIAVEVRNVGSLPVRGSRGGIQVAGIINAQAPLYGPNGAGGFNLGAPIAPGATGLFIIDAAVGTLSHCQNVTVRIDTAQALQSGTSLVFYNDSKVLTAIDTNAMRPCVGDIRP